MKIQYISPIYSWKGSYLIQLFYWLTLNSYSQVALEEWKKGPLNEILEWRMETYIKNMQKHDYKQAVVLTQLSKPLEWIF